MNEEPSLPLSNVARNVAIGIVALLATAAIATIVWRVSVALRGPPRAERSAPLRAPAVHRASGSVCPPSRRTRERDPELAGCASDAECTEGKNGRCEKTLVGHARFANDCRYDRCTTDADCHAGEDPEADRGPCECGENGETNVCASGNCSVDSDCGPGGYCSPSFDFHCGYEGGRRYYCRTKNDLCTDDADCPDAGPRWRPECRYDKDAQRWACSTGQCRIY
jgi:hypothetical protein